MGTSLKFSIPYRKLVWRIFGLSFVLLFIAIQFLLPYLNTLISEEIYPTPMISLPFALILLLISVLMVLELLWLLLGLEVVEVDSNHIVIKHQILGLGLIRKLRLKRVNGVFVSRQDSDLNYYLDTKEFKFFFLTFKRGKVAINYGKTIFGGINTIRFGAHLGEAKQIVKLIHEKFPQYIYEKSKNTG